MHDFEREFIDFQVELGKKMGTDSLASRLFMMLFLEPGELSMEELSERTGYSLASIHNKMKILEKVGHIRRINRPGSKKIFYYMEKDMMKTFREMIEASYSQRIEPTKEFLASLLNKYSKAKLSKDEQKKMDILISYQKQLLKMERIGQKIREEFAHI